MVTDETGRPQVNDLDFTPGPHSQSADPNDFWALAAISQQLHDSTCTASRQ